MERTCLSHIATFNEVIDGKFQYSISVILLLSYISSITNVNASIKIENNNYNDNSGGRYTIATFTSIVVYVFEIPNTLCTTIRN